MDFIAVANRRLEFMGINAGVVYQDFDKVEQFVFSGKKRFLHFGKLPDEMFQAFTHSIPRYGYRVLSAGELPMCCVDMYGNSHVSNSFPGDPGLQPGIVPSYGYV